MNEREVRVIHRDCSASRRGAGALTAFGLSALIATAGCSVALTTPADANIRCATDSDCPPPGACNPVTKLCMASREALDACAGRGELEACSSPGIEQGLCHSGLCVALGCGNGLPEPGEACDDGNQVSGDGCSADCQSNESCGNGITDVGAGEGCDCGDGSVPLPSGCTEPNSTSLEASCRPDCQRPSCGDGIVVPPEQCEAGDLQAQTCEGLGYYAGTLACDDHCRFDESGCAGWCGNGVIEGDEQCDGSDLNGKSCLDLGYYAEEGLACKPGLCAYDTSQCQGWCGDGEINGDEQCDGDNLGSSSCLTLGYYFEPGLACKRGLCAFDTSQCLGWCGDGQINGQEQCDGENLGGADCLSVGYTEPAGLGCNPSLCVFDTSQCQGKCGDGVVSGEELCDGSPPEGIRCVENGYDAGPVLCSAFCSPDFSSCAKLGWSPMLSGTTYSLRHIMGSSASDVWVVNGVRSIGHYDGQRWSFTELEAMDAPEDVWVNTPDDAFIATTQCDYATAGVTAAVYRWNGDTWTRRMTGMRGALVAIWGTSGSDVFAIGTRSEPNGPGETRYPAVLHFNGSDWTQVYEGAASAPSLRAIWGSGPEDVFVVGENDTLLHYGTTGWETMDPPAVRMHGSDTLVSVWGTSGQNVYAVGYSGILWHYDGDVWTELRPDVYDHFAAVFGTGPNDIWVLGQNPGVTSLHYDGHVWLPVQIGTSAYMFALWAAGPGDIFAAGANGQILRYSGSMWVTDDMASTNHIETMAADGTSIWAGLYTPGFPTQLSRFDGESWSEVGDVGFNTIMRIWPAAADDLYFVTSMGPVMRYSGGSLATKHDVGNTCFDIWGSSATDIYIGCNNRVLRHYDGGTWHDDAPYLLNGNFTSVWGTSATNVWAFTNAGDIFHRTTGDWVSLASPTTESLVSAWGSGAEDIFVGGSLGSVLHYDGTAWRPMAVGSGAPVNALWGSGPNNVFAGGPSGVLQHYDGARWTMVASNTIKGFISIAANSPRDVMVGGAEGLRRRLLRSGVPEACTLVEIACEDGIDNDCDFLLDGKDPDCKLARCVNAQPIACGDTVRGTTVGFANSFADYNCGGRALSGPERSYLLRVPTAKTATITLTALSADLDLVVSGAGAMGCEPARLCLATSGNTGMASESITVPLAAGKATYVIIDGFDGAAGSYELQVNCGG